jgi:hypothetical protein
LRIRTIDVIFGATIGFILGYELRAQLFALTLSTAVKPEEFVQGIEFDAYDGGNVEEMPTSCRMCGAPEPDDDSLLASWYMVSKGATTEPPMLFCCAEHAEAFFA